MPILWVTDEWITFFGKTVAREVRNPVHSLEDTFGGPYPRAWPVIAAPGFSDAAELAKIFGVEGRTDRHGGRTD